MRDKAINIIIVIKYTYIMVIIIIITFILAASRKVPSQLCYGQVCTIHFDEERLNITRFIINDSIKIVVCIFL